MNPFISNRKGEIHEVDAFGERSEHPGEFTIGVHRKLVVIPPLEVDGRVWMMEPEAEAVVNVAEVGSEGVFKPRSNFKLINPKIESSVVGGRRGAHGRAIFLDPVGITKLEDIISHEDSEAFDYFVGKATATERGCSEEHGNLLEGVSCVNVGIHRHSVTSKHRNTGGCEF